MKKILLSLSALMAFGMLTTASAASDSAYTEKHLSYSYMDLGGSTGSGVEFGAKFMVPTTLLNTDKGGLEFGLGVNTQISAVDTKVNNTTSSIIYGVDADLYTAYTYDKVVLGAGVGYGMTVVADSAYVHGVLFSGSVEYRFTDTFGAKVEYKGGTMSLETTAGTGPDVDQSQVIAGITWGF